jgi:rhamnulokinase
LQGVLTGRDIFRATGVQTMEINTSFQLASMVRRRDRQLLEAHSLLMIPDLFTFLLSGAKRAEYTDATTTQLFDLRTRRWSQETLAKLELPPRIFQEVVLPGTLLGNLLPSVQTDCGFVHRFPCIAVGSHDTASAVAAIPELGYESVFLSSGTWSLMGVAAEESNLSDEFFYGGFTNEGSVEGGVLLLKNLTGLWIMQECVRMWDADGKHYAWAEVEMAASKATAFRSFIDPSAREFQSPSDMRAAVQLHCARSGQPIPETVGEIGRCVFESMSFSYRELVESMERITGRSLGTIRIVGGGALNHFLCQMTADACEREVIAGPVEAAALGNTMVQAIATGQLKDFAEGREALKRSVPFQSYAPSHDDRWLAAFEQYKRIVASANARSLP